MTDASVNEDNKRVKFLTKTDSCLLETTASQKAKRQLLTGIQSLTEGYFPPAVGDPDPADVRSVTECIIQDNVPVF